MFTGSTLGPVSAGFGELRKEEEAQPRLFLAFLNQSSLPFLQAQPCCWFVLFFGYLHYLGSRFFYVGATFFCTEVTGVFQGALLGASLFSLSMQAATAAIISWDAMRLPTPSCLCRAREVESPRGRECASSLTQLK